jgi:hypothetical protein
MSGTTWDYKEAGQGYFCFSLVLSRSYQFSTDWVPAGYQPVSDCSPGLRHGRATRTPQSLSPPGLGVII